MALSHDSSVGSVSSGTSASASHSLGSGSGNERGVFLICSARGNTTGDTAFSTPTYNSSSTGVTLVGTITGGTGFNVRISIYYVLDTNLPSGSGSYTAAVSSSGGQQTGIVAVSYEGVDQSDPTGDTNSAGLDSATDPINLAVTTDEDGSVVLSGAGGDLQSTATTTQTGQVERYDGNGSTNLTLLASTKPEATAGSSTSGWDFATSPNRTAQYLVEVHASGAAASGVNIETANVAQGNAGGTTAHTLTTKDNRGVLVLLDDESESQASAVTYDGESMTLVDSSTATVGAGNASSMWFILEEDLPTGGASYNVSVTGLDAGASVSVVELNNVAQVVPSGTAVDTTETGGVATSSATVTAPSGDSISVGILGHGNTGYTLDDPPTGTGTWIRLFKIDTPPTGAELGCGYQKWTTSGSKTYTEDFSGTSWYRASQIHAVFAAYVAPSVGAHNAPFFGCNF